MQGSAKTCYIKQGLRVRCCTSHDKPRLGMIVSLKGGTTPGRTGDAHRQATRHIDTMNGCLGHRGVEEHVLHNHNTGTFPARCWRMLLQAHYCKVYEPMALSCRQANKTHGTKNADLAKIQLRFVAMFSGPLRWVWWIAPGQHSNHILCATLLE